MSSSSFPGMIRVSTAQGATSPQQEAAQNVMNKSVDQNNANQLKGGGLDPSQQVGSTILSNTGANDQLQYTNSTHEQQLGTMKSSSGGRKSRRKKKKRKRRKSRKR